MLFEKPAVVIDNGSYIIKAGFACDNHPVSMFRTVVGRPGHLRGAYGRGPYEVYIGDAAVSQPELELSAPVVGGRIVHWDNMERIWHHTFYRELKVAPEDRAVILACSSSTPMGEKIQCCEVLMETLNVPGLCVQPQSVLSVYGCGCTTGISVDLGHDTCDVNPVYEGGLVHYAHTQTKLSARNICGYIKDSFDARGLDLGAKTGDIIEGVKKNCLYVTQNAAMSRKNYKRTYVLPSGESVDASQEAFMCAEIMFQPDLVLGHRSDVAPIQEAVYTAALKCDPDLRAELFDAIVLWGGLSMIPGFSDRLACEMEKLVGRPVRVLASCEAYATAWLGGATFAALPDATKMWVTKQQFEEHGDRIVRNKYM